VADIDYVHLQLYRPTSNKTNLYCTIWDTGIKSIPDFIKHLIFIIKLYSVYEYIAHAICTDSPTFYSVVYFTTLYLRTYNVDGKGQVIVVYSI
jgi:hypothetical protein